MRTVADLSIIYFLYLCIYVIYFLLKKVDIVYFFTKNIDIIYFCILKTWKTVSSYCNSSFQLVSKWFLPVSLVFEKKSNLLFSFEKVDIIYFPGYQKVDRDYKK